MTSPIGNTSVNVSSNLLNQNIKEPFLSSFGSSSDGLFQREGEEFKSTLTLQRDVSPSRSLTSSSSNGIYKDDGDAVVVNPFSSSAISSAHIEQIRAIVLLETDPLKEKVTVLESENKALHGRFTVVETENQGLRIENGQLKEEITTVRGKNGQLEAEVTTVRDENGKLEAEVTTVRDENGKLEAEVTTVRDENGKLEAEVTTVRDENGKLEAEVTTVRDENRTLEAEVTTVRDENRTLEAEVTTVRDENRTLEAEVTTVRDENRTLGVENIQQRDAIQRIERAVNAPEEKKYLTLREQVSEIGNAIINPVPARKNPLLGAVKVVGGVVSIIAIDALTGAALVGAGPIAGPAIVATYAATSVGSLGFSIVHAMGVGVGIQDRVTGNVPK